MSDTPRVDALAAKLTEERIGCNSRMLALASQLERELAAARLEAKSLQGFADLWYFAMDHAPGEFERIVTTCSPATWMHEIAKLRRGERA